MDYFWLILQYSSCIYLDINSRFDEWIVDLRRKDETSENVNEGNISGCA